MERLPPKLLTGPSPIGAGQARALELRGGSFQWSQRDANTVVKKQGEFRKVIVSGGGYLARGNVKATPDDFDEPLSVSGMSGALPYQLPFLPGSWQPAVPLGQDQYMAANRVANTSQQLITTEYAAHPPSGSNDGIVAYSSLLSRFDSLVWRGTPRGVSNFLGGVSYAHTRALNIGGAGPLGGWVIPTSAHLTYVSTAAGKTAMVPFLADLGRTDSEGRVLPDLVLSTWSYGGQDPQSYAYSASSFTRANAEFSGYIGSPFAMRERSGLFLGEYFFAPGLSGSPAASPKVWLAFATGHNYSALSFVDVTALMFDGMPLPPVRGFTGETWTWYAPDDGNAYNARLATTLGLMRAAVLPNNILLVAYAVATGSTSASDVAQWACRIARIDFTGLGSISITMDELSTTASRDPHYVIEDIVHIGEGQVIAKRVDYLGAVQNSGRAVTFLRSVDAGLTWSEFMPTGLDANLSDNQHFGRITVHQPRSSGAHGTLLMPSWYPADSAYHAYESKDGGASWVRKGRMARTAGFPAMNTYYGGELAGALSFALLTPSGDLARAVDVTIPDRYTPLE